MLKYLNKAMRGLISCMSNPYTLFAMATQFHLSTQPLYFDKFVSLFRKKLHGLHRT